MDSSNSLSVNGRDVHVWSVRTDCGEADVARLRLFLSPAERERAAQFRFEHLQNAFILARGALRILLGRYLNVCADAVQFGYAGNRKPALAPEHRLKFNLSHSSGLAIFAFTLDQEIGIDLEYIRSVPEMVSIAERFFCPEETSDLMSLPAGERERAFFLCWTRKEAYVKALGNGLSEPLSSFRVTVKPDKPARFVQVGNDLHAARLWTIHDLPVKSGYAGALVYRDVSRPLRFSPTMNATELLLAEGQPLGPVVVTE